MLDNYDLWEQHDRERERELQKLPKCDECMEHIQDDHYYVIGGEKICPACLDAYYRVEIEI
jgi:formylmethanofuran dehydrogenase subunit E